MGPSGSGKSTLMNLIGCLDTPTVRRVRPERPQVARMTDDELAAHPQPGDRLRLPDVQPPPAHERAAAGRAAARLLGPLEEGAPRAGREGARGRRASADRMHHNPTSSRAASASASRSRAPSSTGRRSSSPTSRRATSTRQTGEEIMALFRELNRRGNTIVLVTHEEDIAAHARRIIRLPRRQDLATTARTSAPCWRGPARLDSKG